MQELRLLKVQLSDGTTNGQPRNASQVLKNKSMNQAAEASRTFAGQIFSVFWLYF
jgi:hypothetical protein